MDIKGIDWNLDGYKKDAHFFLCGAFESFDYVHSFVNVTRKCPWLLKDNVIIDSVFGSPTCIWNGGRTLVDVYYNKQKLHFIHDAYADLGIKVRLIFTNPLLNEYDLYDRYSNLVMSIFHDLAPEVVVNSKLLETYLRAEYPKACFVSSTTKRLRSSEAQLKEIHGDYKYVCLDYDYNHNEDFLSSIDTKDRGRIEILVNSICPKNCNVRVLHQNFSAERQLEFDIDDICDETEPFIKECPFMRRSIEVPPEEHGYTRTYLAETNYIFPQDLDKYLAKGYSHFKIQGRELPVSLLLAEFLPYLIKPEFYPMAFATLNNYKTRENMCCQ